MYIKPSKTVKKRFNIRLSHIIPLVFLLICIPIFNVWGTTETNSIKPEGFMNDSGYEINDRITGESGLVYLPELTEFTSMAAVKVSTNIAAPKELTNVIDKVRMAALDNSYYGEWTASYGENGELINTSTGQAGKFHSGASFRLELDWSTKGESLSAGDYFTFRIPKGFIDTKYIKNQSSGVLYEDADNDSTPVVAHYTLEVLNDSVNLDNDVLITFTFTEYVNDKNKIVGDFWLMCYAQNFDGTDEKGESKAVEFEINADGSLQTFSFDVTVLPPRPAAEWEPSNYNYIKYGSCSPSYILDGFYYFRWEMYINMDFNTNTPVVDHFKIEDVIPSDSPHKFISPADNDGFGEQKNIHRILIREYIGADEDVYDTPEKRYTKLKADYNADDSENWIHKCFRWNGNTGYFLPDCEGLQVLTGVDGGEGINVTGFANPSSDASYMPSTFNYPALNDDGKITYQTKIFGKPDADKRSQVTKFRLARQATDANGEIRKLPWVFEVQNGTGIKVATKTGGFYMQGESFKLEKKANILMSDFDFFFQMSKVAQFVNVWELAMGAGLIKMGRKAMEEYFNSTRKNAA